MKRILTMALCIVLTAVIAIGGTMAYISRTTETFKNTFTYGNITLDFASEYKNNYSKDQAGFWNKSDKVSKAAESFVLSPILEVDAGSDECYVYMMVKKSAQFDTYITAPAVSNSWTLLATKADYTIYYTEVNASASATSVQAPAFYQSTAFTSKDYTEVPTNGNVYVEHLGFAVQKAGFTGGPTEAWNQAFGTQYPLS